MKLIDIAEQLQRRKSPEEIATAKAAPDYWKKGLRDEFNALLKRYGATSRELGKQLSVDTVKFDRSISVLVSGEDSLMPHRDIRARALVNALAKWLHSKVESGYDISIGTWGKFFSTSEIGIKKPNLETIQHHLSDSARVEGTIDWLKQGGARGAKLPVKFDLMFSITRPSPEVE